MKAPSYVRQVSDAGPVQVRQSGMDVLGAVNTALKAQERADTAIARGVAVLGAGLDRMQEEKDAIIVSRAINDFYKASTDACYNPESGFLHAKGEAAMGVAGRVAESNAKLAEEAQKNMSPAQKRKFAEGTANFTRSSNSTAMRYEAAAVDEYKKEEYKRGLDNVSVAWSVAPDMSIEAQADAVNNLAFLRTPRTGNADVDMKNIRLTTQELIGQTALQIAAKDPLAAQEFMKKNGSALEAGERAALELKIDKAAKPQKAQQLSESLYAATGGSLEKMLTTIEKDYSGEDENYFKSAAKQYWSEQKQFAELRAGDALDKTMELMHTGGYAATKAFVQQNKAALGDKYWQTVDAVDRYFERGKFSGSGGGASSKLSPAQKIELYDTANAALASGKYDGQGGKKKFLSDYGKYLYADDLRKLTGIYFDGDGKQSDFFNLRSSIDKIKSEYGITMDVDEDLDFSESLADALRAKKKECTVKGVPFSNREKIKIVRDLCSEVVVGHEENWFNRLTGTEGKEIKARKYQRESALRKGTADGGQVFTSKQGNTYVRYSDGTIKGWKPDKKITQKDKGKK